MARPTPVWQDLLGSERFALAHVIAQQADEDQDTAATRVWAADECLKKAGAPVNAPLVLLSSGAGDWIVLAAGLLIAATYVASVRDTEDRLVLAVLVRSNDAGL